MTSSVRSKDGFPGFPIVLHGSSSIPQDAVATINRYGGRMKDSIGIPEDAAPGGGPIGRLQDQHRLRRKARHDREDPRDIFALKPEEFDPRKYLGPARDALRTMYMDKNKNVLGSAGRAAESN